MNEVKLAMQYSHVASLPGAPQDQVVTVKAATCVPVSEPVPQASWSLGPGLLGAGVAGRGAGQEARPLSCHVRKGHQARLHRQGRRRL